jgi:hypothetical protein
MSETQTRGGFIGDPAAALNPTGGSGCCGSPADPEPHHRSTLDVPLATPKLREDLWPGT